MDSMVIGRWALIIGIVLAVVAGAGFAAVPSLPIFLFILGLIVGFLNIAERESTPFLVAVIALLVIGIAGLQLGKLTTVVVSILNNFIAFVAAAGLIVALKQILAIVRAPSPQS